MRRQQIVNAAENAVDQRDQGEERNQHGGHVERQVQAVGGALGRGVEHVAVFALELDVFELGRPGGERLLGFRHQHLGDQDGSRRGHDDGRQQMPRLDAVSDVGAHDCRRKYAPCRRS